MESPAPNPYEASLTESPEIIRPLDSYIPATRGLRFANFLIDQIAMRVLISGLGFMGGFVLGAVAPEQLENNTAITIVGLVVAFGGFILYFVMCEWLGGRTLGKLVTGTKVVDENGCKPSFGRALGRSLCRFIPFEPFSFFGQDARGWHDSISKTWVVKAHAVKAEPFPMPPRVPGVAPTFRPPAPPSDH